MQYRNGTINSTTALISSGVILPLGFLPDRFVIYNRTKLQVNPPNSATPAVSQWLKGMPNASANQTVYTAGAPAESYITSNGVTPVTLGGYWANTLLPITSISNANPGVVTLASIALATGKTLANGMTVTISGVNGMKNLNTNRFVVAGLAGAGPYTFNLYDTFGNPVDTTGFGTFGTSPNAQLDVISTPPTAPVLNSVTGQVLIPGQPVGLQLDEGYQGVNLGSAVLGTNGDELFWEAFYATPTGW